MFFWNKYHQLYYKFLQISLTYLNLYRDVYLELQPNINEKILDAGCGPGFFSKKLLDAGCEVYSLDISKTALEHLKKISSKSKIFEHDLSKKLPFENSFFDKIISINTLYTLSNEKIENVLKEFKRVLKAGGTLVIVDPEKSFSNMKIFFSDVFLYYKQYGIIKTLIFFLRKSPLYFGLLIFNIIIDIKAITKKYHFQTEESYKQFVKNSGYLLKNVHKVYAQQCIMISSKD